MKQGNRSRTRGSGDAQRLLSGTVTVAAGLGVAGLGTVLMMALSARALPPADYAAFAIWWTVATLLAFAFGVFEAYLARLMIGAATAGQDFSAITGALVARAWMLVAVMSPLILLASPLLASSLFANSLFATLMLPVFLFLAATQSLQRGYATGRRHFAAVAVQLTADGVLRAGLIGLLILTGRTTLDTLVVAVCVAAAASIVIGSRLVPGWFARPRLTRSTVSSRPILLLLVGAGGAVITNSGSAPWLAAVGHENAFTVGAFAGAVTLSRIPTQFASAAFGPLLAQLSHSAELRDRRSFRRLQRSSDRMAVGCALGFTALFALAGPRVLAAYLGPGYTLAVGTLAALATASGLMLCIIMVQASLAALERWTMIAAAWISGVVVLVVVLIIPIPALVRAAAAPLAAVTLTLAFMLVARARGADGSRPGSKTP